MTPLTTRRPEAPFSGESLGENPSKLFNQARNAGFLFLPL